MVLHQKDLKNALEAASTLGLTLPVTTQVKGYVDSLVDQGKGENDHGGIVQELEAQNNAEIHK
jgi:2-hydroxy-3-oxopropionate reductase